MWVISGRFSGGVAGTVCVSSVCGLLDLLVVYKKAGRNDRRWMKSRASLPKHIEPAGP
jgi:hypothetical protein